MVMSVIVCICGWVRSVMKGMFVFWIIFVIYMVIVLWFSLMLDVFVYLVGLVYFVVF